MIPDPTQPTPVVSPVVPLAPGRIVIVGNTGSGKTTLARRAAAVIGGRHIELDALYHEANWVPAELEVFRGRIRAAIAEQSRWVTDGPYRSLVWDITWAAADEIVWLDLPFPLTFSRMFRRAIGRIIRREMLWNGNRETVRGMFFSRDSLIRFSIMHRNKYRKAYPEAFKDRSVAGVRVSRLRSRAAVEAWLRRLAHDVATLGVSE